MTGIPRGSVSFPHKLAPRSFGATVPQDDKGVQLQYRKGLIVGGVLGSGTITTSLLQDPSELLLLRMTRGSNGGSNYDDNGGTTAIPNRFDSRGEFWGERPFPAVLSQDPAARGRPPLSMTVLALFPPQIIHAGVFFPYGFMVYSECNECSGGMLWARCNWWRMRTARWWRAFA